MLEGLACSREGSKRQESAAVFTAGSRSNRSDPATSVHPTTYQSNHQPLDDPITKGALIFLSGNALQAASHAALARLSRGQRKYERSAYRIPRGLWCEVELWCDCPMTSCGVAACVVEGATLLQRRATQQANQRDNNTQHQIQAWCLSGCRAPTTWLRSSSTAAWRS